MVDQGNSHARLLPASYEYKVVNGCLDLTVSDGDIFITFLPGCNKLGFSRWKSLSSAFMNNRTVNVAEEYR